MKRLLKVLGVLVLATAAAVAGVAVLLVATAARPARPVAIDQVMASVPGQRPVMVTLFYPTRTKPRLVWTGAGFTVLAPRGEMAPGRRPLIILSHGTGASPVSHIDTALKLAEAGYVVAAPLHGGDNFGDQSAVGGPDWIQGRARDLATTADFLLGRWSRRASLDSGRVGVFGFSAGGITALVAAGAKPDLNQIAPHCAKQPEFVCKLFGKGPEVVGEPAWTATPVVRAAVIVAPGLGFTLPPERLSEVTVPVQLWQGEADVNVPPATNAEVVRRGLKTPVDYRLTPGAGHFSFLAPCTLVAKVLMPRMLCADRPGFDRKAFHARFNTDVVAFFDRTLGVRRS